MFLSSFTRVRLSSGVKNVFILATIRRRLDNPRFLSSSSGSNGGGGDDDNSGGDKKTKRPARKEKSKATDENEISGTSSSASNDLVVPSSTSSSSAIERMPIGENAPRPGQLLAVPIARRPVFPGFMAPLVINDEGLMSALMTIKASSKPYVGLFLVKDPTIDLQVDKFSLTSMDQINHIGVLAHIQQMDSGPAGAIAMVMSHRRIRATGTVARTAPPLVLKVEHIHQPPLDDANTDEVKATCNEILATLREIIRVNPLFQQHIAYFTRKIDVTNPYALADFAASLTTLDAVELQDVLETFELQPRLRKALLLLKKEQQLSQLQQAIKQDVEKRMDKQQRQYFLQEQLKSIKKELGLEKDDKESLISKFSERIAKVTLPATAKAVYDEEIEKLQTLERNSSEFNVTRAYLDWLTSLPWGKFSLDNFDIGAARVILDEDHYGMADVKDRILEFVAVGKLRGTVQGKILCLVGPPGVGKTSIGKSIARSLNRQFYRFSVGGLSDVAEIKGHRRTYIGAMPGKLIQCLKSTGVSNPLVLIDEIDKLGAGRGYSGDPASALLEMLDPNQNSSFMDHYLDTPVDASKVLFICTANTLDTIPGPLLDRMEVIRLSGYDAPEKLQIAKKYLEPKTRAEVGLEADKQTTPKSLELREDAIEHLIRWYARESGVRTLEKLIGKIFRKAAIKIVSLREKVVTGTVQSVVDTAKLESSSQVIDATQTETSSPSNDSAVPPPPAAQASTETSSVPPPSPQVPLVEDSRWIIDARNLDEWVGKPLFSSDRLYDSPPPGVATGLAWTSMGGSALYIEVVSPYLRSLTSSKLGSTTKVPLDTSDATDDSKGVDKRFPSGGSLRITGKMGDVMQESAQIAHTLARRFLRSLDGESSNDFLDVTPLHMHVPEGSTPKDGPSAGVTMTSALLSAALDRPLRADCAMTGEVDLIGTVLPVGGIKEKTMAARRAGIRCLIFPKGNKRDWDELPTHLTDGIEVHFAATYQDVYNVALKP
jgi:Lon-like ATP-dependent protease